MGQGANANGLAAVVGVAALGLIGFGAVAACGGEEQARAPGGGQLPAAEAPAAGGEAPPADAPAREGPSRAELVAQGRELFLERCATCHGENGDGQGPGSAGLNPKPRDFRDPEWQRAVSDEHIERVIAYGGAAVGLSPLMPAQPDLANDPQQLEALRVFIRSLGEG